MNEDPADPHTPAIAAEDLRQTVVIATEGVQSEEHAREIEQTLRSTAGVLEARADLASARVAVAFDPRKTNVAALHECLEGAGYKPSAVADLDFREPEED